LTNHHIFMEIFFFSKIQNGGFIQDGGKWDKILQELYILFDKRKSLFFSIFVETF
jgi:hypothetical protein